jgi:hypothetical protein
VIACYRRRQGWSLSSTIAEFEQFSEPEGTFSDMQFIENFPLTTTVSTKDVLPLRIVE